MENNKFIKLLKENTSIDKKFIDLFMIKFKIGEEYEFVLDEIDVSTYLKITYQTLRKRLNGAFNADIKNKEYIENLDYIRVRTQGNKIKYLLNYACFEKLAMAGNTKESIDVRNYFAMLRKFIYDNRTIIYQAINNNIELQKTKGFDSIYFFVVDKRYPNIIKLGETKDIIARLRTYNTGRIKDIELKYFAIVSNSKLIETCVKKRLVNNKIIKNRELYEIKSESIKLVIDSCYKDLTKQKEHAELYEELSQISGLYSYVKDKVNIKPFIIINR